MNNTKNTVGVVLFIVILLLFIVGGYFFMNYMLNDYPQKKEEDDLITELKEIRLDSTKDYIYYENYQTVLNEIYEQDVIINVKGFESVNSVLANELSEIKNTKKTIDDVSSEENITCDNAENLYSFNYREYYDTQFGNYISLVISDFEYNCVSGSVIKNIKSYNIDKKTGKQITDEELLNKFNITEDVILEKIRKRLNDTQVLDGDTQVIDIDGTIDSIKNGEYNVSKALSINKTGNIIINFIVKSNKINYNDTVELN